MEVIMINEFIKIKEKVITGNWIESAAKGKGGVGITLESILGKERENLEIPDYHGIELKAKCSTRETHITLFGATPDSYLFEIKRIQKEYGYPDATLPQFNIFNLSIYGDRYVSLNHHYFTLSVDQENKQIVLNIYDNHFNLIDNLVSWSFEMVKEQLERKLSYLAIVHAERKFQHNVVYFKYNDIHFYQLKSFEEFIQLVACGIIRITFRISVYKSGRKYGEIYDHGTIFSIDEKDITKLFDKII